MEDVKEEARRAEEWMILGGDMELRDRKEIRSALDAAIDIYAEARATEETLREVGGKYDARYAKIVQRRRATVTALLDMLMEEEG